MKPVPPSEARERPPRPGGLPRDGEAMISIPASEFHHICEQLRRNELLGAAAVSALEAAAGLTEAASPQSAKAKELREKVAGSRDADDTDDRPKEEEVKKPKKKKAMMFAVEEPEEIPDAVAQETTTADEPEEAEEAPPELNLNPKQNKMRTDLEMWVMDEVPALFGVDDSEELEEALQEDGQADQITKLISEGDADKRDAPEDKKAEFVAEVLAKIEAIQSAGKKKKKKKKVEAEE
eukprot:TRINITY_DN31070_c0_g1_i2.p1 TRINITY_DN31070_c0_g1~~TRINITY_DN31070_c0_g1_i2.p1  ORF type:complete len:237 (+),score=81.38 TRINITY_DN31070_c0_g1_i2:138-848(+)